MKESIVEIIIGLLILLLLTFVFMGSIFVFNNPRCNQFQVFTNLSDVMTLSRVDKCQ